MYLSRYVCRSWWLCTGLKTEHPDCIVAVAFGVSGFQVDCSAGSETCVISDILQRSFLLLFVKDQLSVLSTPHLRLNPALQFLVIVKWYVLHL